MQLAKTPRRPARDYTHAAVLRHRRCSLAHVASRQRVRARRRGSGSRPWSVRFGWRHPMRGRIQHRQKLGSPRVDHIVATDWAIVDRRHRGWDPISEHGPRHEGTLPIRAGEAVRANRSGTQSWHNRPHDLVGACGLSSRCAGCARECHSRCGRMCLQGQDSRKSVRGVGQGPGRQHDLTMSPNANRSRMPLVAAARLSRTDLVCISLQAISLFGVAPTPTTPLRAVAQRDSRHPCLALIRSRIAWEWNEMQRT